MTSRLPAAAFLIGAPIVSPPCCGCIRWSATGTACRRRRRASRLVHVGWSSPSALAVGCTPARRPAGLRAAAAPRRPVPFVAVLHPLPRLRGVRDRRLGQELNGLPAAEREAVAPGLIEDFARNPILGEPASSGRSARSPHRRGRLHPARLPPRRRAGGAPGAAGRLGADRTSRPAARPDRPGLLLRGRLDGAPDAPVGRRAVMKGCCFPAMIGHVEKGGRMSGRFEATVVIDRPIEDVFAFLADGENDPKLSRACSRSRRREGTSARNYKIHRAQIHRPAT